MNQLQLLSAFEAITVAQAGDDVFTVFADFFAQSRNVYINGAVEHNNFV